MVPPHLHPPPTQQEQQMPESTGGGTKWFSSQFDRRRTKASSTPIEHPSDEGTPVLPEADGYEALDEAKTIDLSLEYATRSASRPEPVGMYTLPGGPLGARVAYGPRTLRILQMIRDTGGRLEPWQAQALDNFFGAEDWGEAMASPMLHIDSEGTVTRLVGTLHDFDREYARHYQEHLEDKRISEEREATETLGTSGDFEDEREHFVQTRQDFNQQREPGEAVRGLQRIVAQSADLDDLLDGGTYGKPVAFVDPTKHLPLVATGWVTSSRDKDTTVRIERCSISPTYEEQMRDVESHEQPSLDPQVKFVAPVDSFLTEADAPDEPGVVEPLVISRSPINRIEAISLDPEEIRVLTQILPQQTIRFASRNWAFLWGEDIPVAQRLAGKGLLDVNMETTSSSPLTVSLTDDGRDWLDLYRWRVLAKTPVHADLEAIVVRALADPADRSGAGLSWGRERTPSPRARDVARRIVRDLEPYFAPNLSAQDAEQPTTEE